MSNYVTSIEELSSNSAMALKPTQREGAYAAGEAIVAIKGDKGLLREGEINLAIRRATSGTLFAVMPESGEIRLAVFENQSNVTLKLSTLPEGTRITEDGKILKPEDQVHVPDDVLDEMFAGL